MNQLTFLKVKTSVTLRAIHKGASLTDWTCWVLHSSAKNFFHYVLILPLLSQLVNNKYIQNTILQSKNQSDVFSGYKSFHDVSFPREISFLCGSELKLPLILYIDDFKVCNPLGIWRSIKSQLCTGCLQTYLQCGYPKVLEPLLQDLLLYQVWAK